MVLPREGLRSLAEQGGATIVGCSPSRAVDHFPVSQQLPSAIPSITKIALEDELTWLSIHSSILLLGTSQKGTSPFAFVTLQHVVVKEVDLAACCIVLVSSLQAVKKVLVPGEQESIALCLLLADGRFQVLEAKCVERRKTCPDKCAHPCEHVRTCERHVFSDGHTSCSRSVASEHIVRSVARSVATSMFREAHTRTSNGCTLHHFSIRHKIIRNETNR